MGDAMEANKSQTLRNRRKMKTTISKDVQIVDHIDISKEGMVVGSNEIESKDIIRVVAKRPRETEEKKNKVSKINKTSKRKEANEDPVEQKTASKSKSTKGPGLSVKKGEGDTVLTREERIEAFKTQNMLNERVFLS
ncbi:hypothetical protein H5410_045467 [Solanum commersonii]|uniref:Uncharacterized protein n=1 Tax=Solanum commersonii TaxID=4109 RepID=A0A9J5X9L9_SOLCO|nr:hypothetical protein H5410_045467 [Solanum commersonii]